jgi:hypothetical protein
MPNKTVLNTEEIYTLYSGCRIYIWAAIQRRGSILAWIVILSVYGADTIAEAKLLISHFLRLSLDLLNQLLGF